MSKGYFEHPAPDPSVQTRTFRVPMGHDTQNHRKMAPLINKSGMGKSRPAVKIIADLQRLFIAIRKDTKSNKLFSSLVAKYHKNPNIMNKQNQIDKRYRPPLTALTRFNTIFMQINYFNRYKKAICKFASYYSITLPNENMVKNFTALGKRFIKDPPFLDQKGRTIGFLWGFIVYGLISEGVVFGPRVCPRKLFLNL